MSADESFPINRVAAIWGTIARLRSPYIQNFTAKSNAHRALMLLVSLAEELDYVVSGCMVGDCVKVHCATCECAENHGRECAENHSLVRGCARGYPVKTVQEDCTVGDRAKVNRQKGNGAADDCAACDSLADDVCNRQPYNQESVYRLRYV